ncbi:MULTISPECIES: class I SAM-dependent methyltransferase [Ramlibacter]|uniref:Methyltransferase domain-containing protein n=1 Tax=Ramlibacter pinisoli TaxID=2682844 RepID=A0A6N8ISB2_9BURK|nr:MULTISPECIES: class I SAM-dependent methyltransferase [Ramlibacter]MBA2964844.1 class I SAM-dependent methyltransferase [Ramlibacter sp. CGMCC 1.13660]MVQ29809.1 methyltransferase domain-containing protein [Ramlibacter pinisoli]
MASRSCPVCNTPSSSARLFLSESIDRSKLSGFSFASRKTPEFMRHRLVQCTHCDLVYADEPPAAEELAHAYHAAEYDSAEEADDAAAAYVRAIGPLLQKVRGRASALEIGTGTGVFLEHLGRAGFARLVGVEPSPAAIAAAPAHRRDWIRQAMFDKSDFAPASFDLVCCFMTMEHVRDPLAVARSARELVRPGGAFVTVTHDWRGLVNRVLGSRSPIIDIEHLQLFSPESLRHLFANAGFEGFDARPFANRYALRYWTRLAPLPLGMKRAVSSGLEATGLARRKLSVNVGNTIAYGIRGD